MPPMCFAIADESGIALTGAHAQAEDAWRELLGVSAPRDRETLRSATLDYVSRGYRVIAVGQAGSLSAAHDTEKA
jgi:hypothetical protein